MKYQEAHDALTDAKQKLEDYRKAIGTSEPDLLADINRRLVPIDKALQRLLPCLPIRGLTHQMVMSGNMFLG